MAGFAREQESIGERLVDLAADETLPGHARYYLRRYGRWAAAAALLLGLGMGGLWAMRPEPAPAPPPPKPAPQPDPLATALAPLQQRLGAVPESELIAWTQLLSRWQVGSEAVTVKDAARCAPTVFPGFNCLRGHASLEQLMRFDRPLLLHLREGDKAGTAMLQGVGHGKVRLDFGGTGYELPRTVLGTVWQGEFSAAWRLPPEVPATLKRGDAGTGVAWVKQQLARLDGKADAELGPAFYDPALEERVRKLQISYGLAADGIVGPETLFALAALGEDGPHLARNVE
jgi:general secretion pathway protein A